MKARSGLRLDPLTERARSRCSEAWHFKRRLGFALHGKPIRLQRSKAYCRDALGDRPASDRSVLNDPETIRHLDRAR